MHKRCPDSRADIRGKENVVDSILCKECKECLFINYQCFTTYNTVLY